MRILQLNLNHCAAAQDLLDQTIIEENIDVAILSEQYSQRPESTWIADKSGKAAIWSCKGQPFKTCSREAHNCFTWANIQGIYFVSCYARPSAAITEFEDFLLRLSLETRGKTPIIIAGDFNAWSTAWGSRCTNHRGRLIQEYLSQTHLTIMNTGTQNTYQKGNKGSIIDIMFANDSLSRHIKWAVSNIYTNSDHMAIIAQISYSREPELLSRNTSRKRSWKQQEFDPDLFELVWSASKASGDDAAHLVSTVRKELVAACDATMRRTSHHNKRRPVYWWNEEISTLRKLCHSARRRLQRNRGETNENRLREEFKSHKKLLKSAITRSKKSCFEKLCEEANIDPWGTAYKICMSRFKNKQQQPKDASFMGKVVETLFPKHDRISYAKRRNEAAESPPLVTEDELLAIAKKIKNTKAPGLDGIPNRALKEAISSKPQLFAKMYNACIKEEVFPDSWKVQRLVLLPKPKKPPEEPSSYRPLCMLDTMGKVYESIIRNRLELAIQKAGGLSERQYGFIKKRSTIDALREVVDTAKCAVSGKRWKGGTKKYCALITLDVKNAFNSAKWAHIIKALDEIRAPEYLINIIMSYFKNRRLIFDTDEGTKSYSISSGVPQGSVLGPLLWNLMYDGVLRRQQPTDVKLVAYADDLMVVAVAKQLADLRNKCNECLNGLRQWFSSVSLKLAEEKTEVLLISTRKIEERIELTIGECEITSQPQLKYLGVILDSKLKFKEHLEYSSGKANKIYNALSRMMTNRGCVRSSRRFLIAKAMSSVILYAAPVWIQAMDIKAYAKQIIAVHRLSAIRVISAFRTISTDAAEVLASMPPIDIQGDELERLYQLSAPKTVSARTEERNKSTKMWQERWNSSSKGRWTHRLIPDIHSWIDRRHGDLDFHLTQILSGHGCFRSYLFRFHNDISPNCPTCTEYIEDSEHVLFYCPRFSNTREKLKTTLGGSFTVDNLTTLMCQSTDKWKAVKWKAVSEASAFIMTKLRLFQQIRRPSVRAIEET
uniref:Reverse transcriptase domain-containing protein n=1 Tax=Bactrocera tryoni TaxID=59916 RepID=A0A142LX37_BACRY|nr:hypothetical protein [Bactrocera tryoni]